MFYKALRVFWRTESKVIRFLTAEDAGDFRAFLRLYALEVGRGAKRPIADAYWCAPDEESRWSVFGIGDDDFIEVGTLSTMAWRIGRLRELKPPTLPGGESVPYFSSDAPNCFDLLKRRGAVVFSFQEYRLPERCPPEKGSLVRILGTFLCGWDARVDSIRCSDLLSGETAMLVPAGGSHSIQTPAQVRTDILMRIYDPATQGP